MITVHPHWNASFYFEPSLATTPWAKRKDAVAAFVSNCKNAGAEKRLDLLKRLAAVYPVHSFGKCLHNTDEPPSFRGGTTRSFEAPVLPRRPRDSVPRGPVRVVASAAAAPRLVSTDDPRLRAALDGAGDGSRGSRARGATFDAGRRGRASRAATRSAGSWASTSSRAARAAPRTAARGPSSAATGSVRRRSRSKTPTSRTTSPRRSTTPRRRAGRRPNGRPEIFDETFAGTRPLRATRRDWRSSAQALLAGALPLYRGADRVDRVLPGANAVVKFADFQDDAAKLAAHLRTLAADASAAAA